MAFKDPIKETSGGVVFFVSSLVKFECALPFALLNLVKHFIFSHILLIIRFRQLFLFWNRF